MKEPNTFRTIYWHEISRVLLLYHPTPSAFPSVIQTYTKYGTAVPPDTLSFFVLCFMPANTSSPSFTLHVRSLARLPSDIPVQIVAADFSTWSHPTMRRTIGRGLLLLV